jgi:hypothetical protein
MRITVRDSASSRACSLLIIVGSLASGLCSDHSRLFDGMSKMSSHVVDRVDEGQQETDSVPELVGQHK